MGGVHENYAETMKKAERSLILAASLLVLLSISIGDIFP
jgi:hypothetical protein